MALEVQTPQMNKPVSPPLEPTDRGKNIPFLIIIVLVILVVIVAVWIALTSLDTSTGSTTTTPAPAETTPQVQDADDLQKLEDQVRDTNIDDLSKDLDTNDTDAAGF